MPTQSDARQTCGHVVLVDDDPSVRKSLQTLLRREGYSVSAHDSAAAVLEQLHFPEPTVVMTDMRMRGLSGVDLQTRLKALGHDMPMVFVSGESRQEEIILAMKQGAVDFLLKPFSAQSLLDTLQRAMRVAQVKWAKIHKQNHVSDLLKRLTPRELEVCHWMVRGYSNQQISAVDGAAPATIKLHRSRVMEKMQAASLPELIEMLSDFQLPAPTSTVTQELSAGE